MKKIMALVLSICLLAISLSPISVFATTETVTTSIPEGVGYTQLLDLSVLTPGSYYADGVFSDTNGIWLNSENITGLQAYDSDGNGKSDLLEARINDNQLASFTLGFNTDYSYENVTAVAVRINCKDAWEHRGDPNIVQDEAEMSYVRVSFVDAEDNEIPCASTQVVGANYNYVDLAGNLTYSEGHWNENIRYGKNADGWVIVDLTAFTDLTLADTTAIKITFPWNGWNNIGVSDIGLVEDTATFINYLKTGEVPEYEKPIPAEASYSQLLDLSVLTPGSYYADGVFSDTNGIWLNSENITGLQVYDSDGNGKSDLLEARINDNQLASFTLGFNTDYSYENATAVAVRINCKDAWEHRGDTGVTQTEEEMSYVRVSFVDAEENEIPCASTQVVGANYNYVDLAGNLTYSEGHWNENIRYGKNADGWVIIDLTAFTDLTLADATSIKITFPWNAWNNVGISDIGLVEDTATFINYLKTGALPSPDTLIPAETGYKKALDLSVLTAGTYGSDSTFIDTKGIWGTSDKITTLKAYDDNSNGTADLIEAHLYDNSGASFTLNFNTDNNYESATAVAVHLDCDEVFEHRGDPNAGWLGDSTRLSYIKISFVDEEENIIEIDTAVTGDYIYYVDLLGDLDFSYELNYQYEWYGANTDGWFIVDLAAFTGLDLTTVKGMKFDFIDTNWNNVGIADIAFLDNANDFVSYLNTGEVHTPEAPVPTVLAKGSDVIKLVPTVGHKYSIDGTTWVDTAEFTGLTVGNAYTIYEYVEKTSSANASEIASIEVTLYLEGDTDHSGEVDGTDLIDVRKHLLGAKTSDDVFAADANVDGDVNIIDLVRIKRIIAKVA